MAYLRIHFLPNEPSTPWCIINGDTGEEYKVRELEIIVPCATVWSPKKPDHPRGWLEAHGELYIGAVRALISGRCDCKGCKEF